MTQLVCPPSVDDEGEQVTMTGQGLLRKRPVSSPPAAVYLLAIYDPVEGCFTYLTDPPSARPIGPQLKIVARSSERVSDPIDEWNAAPAFGAKDPDLGDVEFFSE
jgi:hypothetical protein